MLKQLSIFRKREDLSQDAFRHYWRNRHPDIVTRLSGIRRYVQNHVTAVLRGEPAWDGIAEVWFDDIESMRANAGNPVLADIRADEANFISAGSMVSIVTEEHTFVDDSTGSEVRKLLALVKRRPDVTVERFQEEWGRAIGPEVADLPGVRRYVQACCRLGLYRAGREPAYDAMARAIKSVALTGAALYPRPSPPTTLRLDRHWRAVLRRRPLASGTASPSRWRGRGAGSWRWKRR